MRQHIAAWKAAFEGDDQAVLPLLVALASHHAAFSAIVELVRVAPEDDAGRKKLNVLVLDLVATGYWTSAFLTIRRLLDKYELDGRRGVNSLRAIVKDVRKCRERLTRRVFVEDIAGIGYDYVSMKARYEEYARRQSGPFWVPLELRYEDSVRRHVEFDWLSGTSSAARSADDLISESVFDRLETRLAQLDRVAEHATLRHVHAATEASRAGRVLENWGLNDAFDALKLLVQTADLVGRWFCYSGTGNVLPHPNFDQFEFLDLPMFVGDRAVLERCWETFAEECARWPYIENDEL
ncbi:hypothetical protein [Lysobacter sp. cf310]|uniref:hypothetical protein n=1 Tax=Lysobacter sp. cf310 TaxID=1761790 RepID=UPI0008E41D06|nr:hypothetical protein [Lysobacter sp. cf310]SFK77147.1 hypothetical protein SAMN04487938_1933 [Lysobacter sp. cf310]